METSFPKPVEPSIAIGTGYSSAFSLLWTMLGRASAEQFPTQHPCLHGGQAPGAANDAGRRPEGGQQDTAGLHCYASSVIQLNTC